MTLVNLFNQIVAFIRERNTVFLCMSLTATWLVLLGVVFINQMLGGSLSLNIHATGEDRVWTDLLERGAFSTHRSWWALASRNPLGPWWYSLTTPFLAIHPSGLYLCKRMVELFVAISAALVFFEVFDRKKMWLSYGLGLLVLIWNFTGYIEQILYLMLIALGCSLLTLYAYLRYLKSRRAVSEWLLLSLAAYFVALGTYTIQCGIPLAVFLCSLAYGNRALPASSKSNSWYRSWYDVSYYGIVFVLFTMIWITTSGPTSSYFKVDTALISRNAIASTTNLLWHQDTVDLTRSLIQNWSIPTMALVVVCSVLWTAAAMGWISSQRERDRQSDESFPMNWKPYVILFAIAFSLSIPTFALESMSNMWYPGSRSRMIQQAFQPIFYSAILFGLISWLRGLQRVPLIAEAALIALIAFGSLIGLEYNRKLAQLSSYERNLVAGLKKIIPEITRPTKFVVRLENDEWYGGQNTEINRILVKQAYDSNSVSLDAVYKGSPDPSICMKIADDEIGVFCPSAKNFVPYRDIVFATFDGKTVTQLIEVDPSTFAGYQAIFERKTNRRDDRLAMMRPAGNEVQFQFDSTPPGVGWSNPEVSVAGESFVWMASKTASFEFYRFANTPIRLRFKTLQPITEEIRDSLKMSLLGTTLPIQVVESTDNKWVYESIIPPSQTDEISVIKFEVARVIRPPGTNRKLAIPFDWIEFKHGPESGYHLGQQAEQTSRY